MELLEILIWIVLGAVIGWIASFIMGTAKKTRGIMNVVIGIAGAFFGGWLWKQLKIQFQFKDIFQERILNILLAGLVGAILLIAILKGLGLLGKGKKK